MIKNIKENHRGTENTEEIFIWLSAPAAHLKRKISAPSVPLWLKYFKST